MPVYVNGERIEDQTIRDEGRAIRPKLLEAMAHEDPKEIEARVKQWSRENVIERVLLHQAAKAEPEPIAAELIEKHMAEIRPENGGCIAPGTESAVRADIEIRLRVDRLMGRVCAHLAAPRNKDISDYYRKHRAEFHSPETVHAAHIVKNVDENQDESKAKAGIEQAAAELKSGADFSEVADRLSDCPGRGGDLGVFAPGQMVGEFDAVVFRMQPGEISGIFRTPFGFHIAKVIERRPEGPLSLEEVSERIGQHLLEEKRRRAMEQYLDKLWAKAEIRDEAGI